MPVTRFSSPFAPLSLSLDEKEQLCDVANTIVGETMALYERFLGQDKGRLDPTTWEKMREREQTRVYLNRHPGGGTGNPDMHLLLTIGTVVGTLHDAMYGALVTTTDAMRIKSAYLDDSLIDMCVLDTIVQPTPNDPFESMVVRWSVHGVPLHVRLLVKHNDAIFIEMTAMRQLSNGERVGVHLTHTVAFDKTPVLKQYSRTNASNCAIWRQTAPDRVEMFLTSYFEVKDSMMAGLVVKALSEVMLAKWKIIECARLKKLSWLVQNKNALAKCEANSGEAPDEGCSVCGSQHRSAHRGIKSACAVCSKYACKKCRVKQTLHMIAPDGQLLKYEMRFCVPCIRSATILDGAAVAADEATRGLRSAEFGSQGYNGVSYTISSSSSSQSSDDLLSYMGRAESEYSSSSRHH